MVDFSPGVRNWLAASVTDIRKGFEGLAAIIKTALGEETYSGRQIVFRGRRGDRVRVLWFYDFRIRACLIAALSGANSAYFRRYFAEPGSRVIIFFSLLSDTRRTSRGNCSRSTGQSRASSSAPSPVVRLLLPSAYFCNDRRCVIFPLARLAQLNRPIRCSIGNIYGN
jgi:IS66 Orf2 like protein